MRTRRSFLCNTRLFVSLFTIVLGMYPHISYFFRVSVWSVISHIDHYQRPCPHLTSNYPCPYLSLGSLPLSMLYAFMCVCVWACHDSYGCKVARDFSKAYIYAERARSVAMNKEQLNDIDESKLLSIRIC